MSQYNLVCLLRSPIGETVCPATAGQQRPCHSLLWRGQFLPGASLHVMASEWNCPPWPANSSSEPGWDLQDQTLLHFEPRAEGARRQGGVCCVPAWCSAASQQLRGPGNTGSKRYILNIVFLDMWLSKYWQGRIIYLDVVWGHLCISIHFVFTRSHTYLYFVLHANMCGFGLV